MCISYGGRLPWHSGHCHLRAGPGGKSALCHRCRSGFQYLLKKVVIFAFVCKQKALLGVHMDKIKGL